MSCLMVEDVALSINAGAVLSEQRLQDT